MGAGRRDVPSQMMQLQSYLRDDTWHASSHNADLIFLTIGGNDILFSGLGADAIVTESRERTILTDAGLISTLDQAKTRLREKFFQDLKNLRPALQKFTGGELDRVVFVPYGNPASHNGNSCQSTRLGFDAHPAFSVNGTAVKEMVNFVVNDFVPTLKRYVTCGENGGCSDATKQKMAFAEGHLAAFNDHGFCAADPATDPEFDRECFFNSNSFRELPSGIDDPLTCHKRASEFRAYASRARWIRTANDSYFTAMTYPTLATFADPADIHDALWGIAAVVYGGAIHPTAVGHAAMGDAALAIAKSILKLPSSTSGTLQ
jgi:hypothetical protein